jgi:hypothetical protein
MAADFMSTDAAYRDGVLEGMHIAARTVGNLAREVPTSPEPHLQVINDAVKRTLLMVGDVLGREVEHRRGRGL